MKIGFDGKMLIRQLTGVERYMTNIFRNMCRERPENEYKIYTRQPAFVSQPLPHKNAIERMFTMKSDMMTTDFLCEGGPAVDLYHMTWFGEDYIDLLPLYCSSVSILTIHDLILFRTPDYFPSDEDHKECQRRCRMAVQLADRIITDSSYTKSDVLANFDVDPDKIEVVLLGAHNSFRRVAAKESVDRVKKRYGLDKPFIFYVGTDFPHKNHEGLIRAFHYLTKEKGLSAQLVFAGARFHAEASVKDLQKLADNLELDSNLVWLEHVAEEELKALYTGADLFVFPSLDEGFGLPLLEAMACGTPVAASNAASIPEVAGDAAIFFDPTDVKDIAEKTLRAMEDQNLRRELIEKGYKRCAELTWEESARQTLAVYDRAMEESRSPKSRPGNDSRDFHRTVLNGIIESLGKYEKHSASLRHEIERLNQALETKERHLQMVLGARSLRYYRKLKEFMRKII